MRTVQFQKWQGAGNDFIIIDNSRNQVDGLTANTIGKLCDRHFGIGADGLMLVSSSEEYDFEMIFYNSDGYPAEMCGNGGRCIAAMASGLGLFNKKASFLSTDGPHEAIVIREDYIKLKMADIDQIKRVPIPAMESIPEQTAIFLNTGVPHLVVFVHDIESVNVESTGRTLRYLDLFSPAGTNVNFVKTSGQNLQVRTYERGVENETLACGTGNVASAIANEWTADPGYTEYHCKALGGELTVSFKRQDSNRFTDVWLEGPAVKVFEGTTRLS